MDDVTQGSPADGTTLGWMMQSRWDWERPVHELASKFFAGGHARTHARAPMALDMIPLRRFTSVFHRGQSIR
jgi:hypothetical protein